MHIPFCVSKCHYCEFNSYPGMDNLFDDYVQALIAEISDMPGKQPLETVYIGGGTPTILPARHLVNILAALTQRFGLTANREVTVEANPGTVDERKLAQLREAGFDRLSIGVQSFDDAYLAKVGRVHTVRQAVHAYEAARRAQFHNIGIDLIFALPGQTLEHWAGTLQRAVEMGPEHVSLYELSIEEGTQFARMCTDGDLDLPDDDAQLEMYEMAISALTAAGFEHYEVSNFARPGFRSRHNQVYWRNEPYYGLGAGATSYVDGVRARRVADPREYIARICSGRSPVEWSEQLMGRDMLAETIVQGLRMLDGVDLCRLDSDYCTDAAMHFKTQIARLVEKGLLEEVDGRIRVTHRGLLLLNDVACEFV